MIRKYYIGILILFLAVFYSCSNSSDKMKYFICKDSIQYWNYNMTNKERSVWFTFSFDKNGNVKKYSFYKGKRWLFEDYGIQPDLHWSISNDSIFNYLGSYEKVKKISDDTIYVIDLKTKEKYIYYKVKGDLNIQKD